MSANGDSSKDIEEQQVPSCSYENDFSLEEHREWMKLKEHIPSLKGSDTDSVEVVFQHTMQYLDDLKEQMRELKVTVDSLISLFKEDEESESDTITEEPGDERNDTDEESVPK